MAGRPEAQSAERGAAMTPGADQCPVCGSSRTGLVDQPVVEFYARHLRVCADCGAAWEPLDPALIWDASDPVCSFREPCDNCAFRPGSPEQRDPKRWAEVIQALKAGSQFYCHKGVPLDLEHKTASDSGFAYPYVNGQPDRAKLRLCRGYLNMLGSIWSKDRKASPAPAIDPELLA